MSTSGNIITDWKRLWQLVCGIHYETPVDTVLSELENVSKELQDGLLQFQPKSASNVKLEDLLKEKKQEKLLAFTKRLQELLDLESKQCWEVLCYYLTNEYRGSASSLTALISTEANMTQLLNDIWGYYRLERIVVLKIVKNLLTFYKVKTHPYNAEYSKIVESLSLRKLRDSYLKQLEYLINELPPNKLVAGEYFNYQAKLVTWSERNAREITETLHILLLLCEHLTADLDTIKRIFAILKQHAFGRQQRYLDATNSVHAKLIQNMCNGGILLLLKCFDLNTNNKKLALEIISALDVEMISLYHQAEHGPLLLCWMLLNLCFTEASEQPELLLKYQRVGKCAVDLNCFQFLHKLLTNASFQDDSLLSRVARQTIYNMLSNMCDLFDGDGSCAKHPYIYELLSELLSWASQAKRFQQETDCGVRSLYNTLLETFPLDFVHLSQVAKALTKAGLGNYIQTELENLPILTDIYDESRYTLQSVDDDEFVLTQAVTPFPHINFTLPAGTSVSVLAHGQLGYCVHLRGSINYFNVLHHEINCLQGEAQHGSIAISERVRRVNAGMDYLKEALQRKTLHDISAEMVHPTEMSLDILHKFKSLPNPPMELLANCLNVCSVLLPLDAAEVFTRINSLNILPKIVNDSLGDYKKYAHGVCFDSCLVGSLLVDVEKNEERYCFLLAYLNFLRTCTKLPRNNYFQVEIPGLVFLLREVFSHMHAWRFQNPADKNKIYANIMLYICDVLEKVTSNINGKDAQSKTQQNMLRNICLYSILNLENGVVLLRFVALGNAYLQHCMEMEANWMIQGQGPVLLVRLAMRILMQVLRLKSCIFEKEELSPLEALIYTQPKQRDTLRIIPVVTSYMSNIFDRMLPILSCRLLRRIALEYNMSLLACLDMEPDQIRLTFLHCLPDELESDSLKISILELVEACIEKQPGVTEAFFKVNFGKERRIFATNTDNVQITDSILTYMEDYLEAVSKQPSTLTHTLPSKIMSIFHSLWMNNMQLLVDELVKKPKFWQKLCEPLFVKDFSKLKQVRVYAQLFNILAMEMFYTTSKANVELKDVLSELFNNDNLPRLLKFMFILPQVAITVPAELSDFYSEDQPDWLCRLQAFKGFLMVLLKKRPVFVELPQASLKMLAEQCLATLVERAEFVEDLRPFIILAEMYLIILQSFKHSYTENSTEDRQLLQSIVRLLTHVAACYEDLHVRAKDANLAIAIKCADLLVEELLKDASIALNFLNAVVHIICVELERMEYCLKFELSQSKSVDAKFAASSTNTFILSLNLLKTVATIFHREGPNNWDAPFKTHKVFQRLLSCTSQILPLHSKQSLTVELLDVLNIFAKGNCSIEFLHCDVADYLWLKLLPPRELLQQTSFVVSGSKQHADAWSVQHWWSIYARGIELVTTLCQQHEHLFLHESLQFVGIHQDYIIDCLLLGKQTLEPPAIKLIKSAIALLVSLMPYQQQWRIEHIESLYNIMRAVQMLMGFTISMFHQPKSLKILVAGRRSQMELLAGDNDVELIDDMITTLNDLTEILILCTKCLQAFSPPLLELICAPELSLSQYECIFEVSFGAPKISEQAVTITFGTVLSVVSVFTKALNLQNYAFQEVPLNSLPTLEHDLVDNTNKIDKSLNQSCNNNTLRPLSKSMSVTSVSSVNAPANELLANLDSELCLMALEHVLTLAATQSILTLKNNKLPQREKALIRREISSELIYLHEFVRKKVLVDYREHKSMWQRRKMGLVPMSETHGDEQPVITNARAVVDSLRRPAADLRINVVRRLHLQQQQQQQQQQSKSPFEMSRELSPIGAEHSRERALPAVASTPHLPQAPMRRRSTNTSEESAKRLYPNVHFENMDEDEYVEEEEEIQMFPPEEPKYSPLSYVQFIEEDYLHTMSNLFMVICQSD